MTQIINELSIQLPIVLDDDEAAQIAEKLLYRAWTEREQFEFQLSFKYAYLDPGDVIALTADGNTYNVRIVSIDTNLPGLVKVRAVADRPSVYDSYAVGGVAQYETQVLLLPGDTILKIMDLPALRDADVDTPGYYLAGYGVEDGWDAATIYKSEDGGQSYSVVEFLTTESVMGTTTNALAAASPATWDDDNTVNVSVANSATLTSDTEINVLNENNACLIGDEIIGFRTATLEGDGTYTLSHLLRGRKGTEWAIDTHTSSDDFVLLDAATVYRVDSNNNQLARSYKYRAVSRDQALEDVTTIDFDFEHGGLKPYSVAQVHGSRDGSDNLEINWSRRSRETATMLWTPVLSEEAEAYNVDIYSGSTVVRTISTSVASAQYPASTQTTDGLTPGDAVIFEIFQISATVGRGYGTGETL